MGRTKEINQAPADMPEILPAKAKALVLAQDELAVILEKDATNVKALAARLGYNGPLQPDALEQVALSKKLVAEQSNFEYGAVLLLLRESCLHGDWLERLERLDVAPRAAQKYMQISLKFSHAPTSAHFSALGKSKLLELVVLDDEEIAAFANGESVRGLTFADADRYSVKELRAKLHDKEQELLAAEKVSTELHKRNEKIERKLKRVEAAPPDVVLAELQNEAAAFMHNANGCILGQLRHALMAIKNHGDEDHSVFMAGLVGQVQANLAALRREFDLPDVSNAADLALAADAAQWIPKKKGV